MTKKLLALGLSLTMALSLAACGGNSGSSASGSSSNTDASTSQADASTGDTSTAAEVTTVEPGKLILGTSADYPPFEFHILDENGEDQIVGLDVALGRQIAEDMGLEFEVIHMDFDNLFQLLNQGRCDMVIAAMEYNEERGENGVVSRDAVFERLSADVLREVEDAVQFAREVLACGLQVELVHSGRQYTSEMFLSFTVNV